MHTQVDSRISLPKHRNKRLLINVLLPTLLVLTLLVPAYAQTDHRFTLHGSAGLSPLVGDVSNRLDNGWHVTAGAGINFASHFSTTIDYTYNGFGVSRRVLNEAQVPDGNAHMWSVTLNPRITFNRISGGFVPYIVGGVGFYRRTVEFTQPTAIPVFLFDPFFGVFFNTLIQADQVLGRISRNGPGGSLGAGFDIKLGGSGVKFFTEARYQYADTGRIPTRMVPVTFGFRW